MCALSEMGVPPEDTSEPPSSPCRCMVTPERGWSIHNRSSLATQDFTDGFIGESRAASGGFDVVEFTTFGGRSG